MKTGADIASVLPGENPVFGLDLGCCAGGCSVGYARAGIKMYGVDNRSQPRYPFTFYKADMLDVLRDMEFLKQFKFIHASPPCQEYSGLQNLVKSQGRAPEYRTLIPYVREYLDEWAVSTGGIWIIENVEGAPIAPHAVLCGTQFDLAWSGRQLRRHRWFESNIRLTRPGCRHDSKTEPWGIYGTLNHKIPGGGQTPPTMRAAEALMGINWMTWRELREAIPPAYTEHLGKQVLAAIRSRDECERELCVI